MLRKLPAPFPRYTFLFVCLLLVAMPEAGLLAGGLAVSPQRLDFEGRTRSAEVLLRTNSPETQTYRLSMVEMDMPKEGPLEIVENPSSDRNSARRLIRFSPRQVTLRPGEVQVIRVRVRKPGDLPDGEYRSHLLFQNVPEVEGNIESQVEQNLSRGPQVRIVPIFGVAIPLIVRHGELHAEATLSELQVNRDTDTPAGSRTLTLTIDRSGNRSMHGDLRAILDDGNGSSIEVGRVNGISVYTPGTHRRVAVPLIAPTGADLSHGTLTVEYRAKAKDGGGLLASSSIPLGGR